MKGLVISTDDGMSGLSAEDGDVLQREVRKPVDEVWEACLGLALQSRGVLRIARAERGGGRLVVVVGEFLGIGAGLVKFVDRWLLLDIEPLDEQRTSVQIGLVSAATGRLTTVGSDQLPPGVKGDRQRSLAIQAGAVLLYALEQALEEEAITGAFATPLQIRSRGTVQWPRPPRLLARAEVVRKVGDLRSLTLRRQHYLLDLPVAERVIFEIVDELSAAARRPAPEIEVFILAEREFIAQVEPNGDFFLSTGILRAAQDRSELAGIIAHELAHLYLDHNLSRERVTVGARGSRVALTVGLMAAGAVLSGLIDTSGPDSATPEDQLLTLEDVLIGAAIGLGALFASAELGDVVGTEAGEFVMHPFVRGQELEADAYATELLWAAGFDYSALARFIRRERPGGWFSSD